MNDAAHRDESNTPSLFYRRLSVWIGLVVSLALTVTVALYLKKIVDASVRREFLYECNEVKAKIIERLAVHARILRSGASFFDASASVQRKDWHIFAGRQKLEQQLPGLQGIGFSLLIPKERLARHIQQIRSEGFSDYQVKPTGDREIYSAIIYLEPFSARNLSAFGYDMLSEPVRRAAMEQARDTDSAVLSGKVVLVQESAVDVQAGTLMYVPVYKKGMPTSSVEERRAAIYGWVYIPCRMNDLIEGVLVGSGIHKEKIPDFKVYDGDQRSVSTLLYEYRKVPLNGSESASRPATQIPVYFNGHRWTLLFTQTRVSPFSTAYLSVWLALAAGLTFTLLLNAMHHSLITRIEAQRITGQLAADLQKSEERYSITLTAVNDGIWDWHVPSGDAFFSPVYYSLLGYDDREFPANYTAWRDLVHPEDLERVERDLQRSVETGKGFEVALRMRMKSGEWLWVSTRGKTAERDSDGKAVRMVGTLSDITDRKLAEQLLYNKNAELERFAYTISHDLKSPLITIQSYAVIISKDMDTGRFERARADLRRIEGAAVKMTALLEDLLALSRAGMKMKEPAPVDMNRLVKDVLTQMEGLVTESHATVMVQPGLPPVVGDRRRIAEVVQNLLENAIKHMGDQAAPRIEMGIRQDGNERVFFVRDNGKGIAPRFHETVFDLFSKLDADSNGTGVGLALVKQIVEMHGGRVWVESEGEGKGSRFCFTIKEGINER